MRCKLFFVISTFFVLCLAACGESGPSATSTPAPTPTPTPAPEVNADLLASAAVISPENVNLLQKQATLWEFRGIRSTYFLPDSQTLMTPGSNVEFWDIITNSESGSLPGLDGVSQVFIVLSADGTHMAYGRGNQVQLWDLANRAAPLMSFTMQVEFSGVSGVAISRDNTQVAALASNGQVTVWDAATGQQTATFDPGPGCVVQYSNIVFTADGSALVAACAGFGAPTKLWNLTTGQLGANISPNGASALALSPDGTLLVTGHEDGTIDLWNMPGGQLRATLSGHTNDVTDMSFSPDGTMLVSSSWDNTIIVWDVAAGRRLTSVSFGDWVWAADFSWDGRFIVAAINDNTGALLAVDAALVQAERAGVRVVSSSGSPVVDLAGWEALVPTDWLAGDAPPRYELRLTATDNEIERCSYDSTSASSTGFSSYTLVRSQPVVTAVITDLESGESLQTQTFDGTLPDACPAQLTLAENITSSVLNEFGDAPDTSAFEAWLAEVAPTLDLGAASTP